MNRRSFLFATLEFGSAAAAGQFWPDEGLCNPCRPLSEVVANHAQRAHRLATSGPYARLRHPQYVGFALIMFGFLVQWPTLVTLVMFPILVIMYALLAKREERDAEAEFGDEYRRYAAATPAFLPRWGGASPARHGNG
jgi:protein-S-isoprenylcysteine O-methyltransferase Ste14